jgi:nucleoid DNA-binding protein
MKKESLDMAVKKAVKAKKVVSKKKVVSAKKPVKKVVKKVVSKKVAKPAKAKNVVAKLVKTSKPVVVSKSPVSKGFTKGELLTTIGDMVSLSKKEVANVMDAFVAIIERHVKKGAVGHFIFPGVLKLAVIRKPATKARPGTNPFTGEPTIFKAKPARNVVKIKALKKIKDMVS